MLKKEDWRVTIKHQLKLHIIITIYLGQNLELNSWTKTLPNLLTLNSGNSSTTNTIYCTYKVHSAGWDINPKILTLFNPLFQSLWFTRNDFCKLRCLSSPHRLFTQQNCMSTEGISVHHLGETLSLAYIWISMLPDHS